MSKSTPESSADSPSPESTEQAQEPDVAETSLETKDTAADSESIIKESAAPAGSDASPLDPSPPSSPPPSPTQSSGTSADAAEPPAPNDATQAEAGTAAKAKPAVKKGRQQKQQKANAPQLDAASEPETKLETESAASAESVIEKAAEFAEAEPAKQPTETETPESPDNTPIDPTVNADPVDFAAEITVLSAELEALSIKNTTRLVTVENRVNRLRKLIPAEQTELLANHANLAAALSAKFEENGGHQLQLETATRELTATLEQALADGQSHEALPAWDKIQGNLSNTSGEIRARIKALIAPFKTKIDELRDWKIFAATEKKKELIQHMQQLIESKMNAGDKAKRISKFHAEWKNLGRSNQNEELWAQFKQFSDKAYEPCKEYFKQRKQQMAENHKARKALIESLEQEIERFKETDIDVATLNKLLSSADADWKRYAPVEQSRIKTLQKRYYDLVNKIRKQRKDLSRGNLDKKKDLIQRAEQLVELEDKQQAMNTAKQLQQEWKTAGPTSFKEDKKLWEQFRAACDKIFSKRSEERDQRAASIKQAEQELNQILNKLSALTELNDEDLRKARADFNEQVLAFSGALDQRIRKQRSKLLDRFNNLKRSLDTRFKTLPDKKSQQLMDRINAGIGHLVDVEDKLLQCKDEAAFEKARSEFDVEAWQQLELTGKETYDSLLQTRASLIQSCQNAANYAAQSQQAETALRGLCIALEIRAGVDTPESDQAQRMALQLSQLQTGFGQSKPSQQENNDLAQDSRLRSLCIGPLAHEKSEQLRERLQLSLQRLLRH